MRFKAFIYDEEGTSEVIGYLLVFMIITASIGIIMVFGIPTIDTARESLTFQKAENNFENIHTNIQDLSRGSTTGSGISEEILIGSGEGMVRVLPTSGEITIRKNNSNGDLDKVYNGSVGNINYQIGNQVIGIENGGFFSKNIDSDLSYISSNPRFTIFYENESDLFINLHIINLKGDEQGFDGERELTFHNEGFTIITESEGVANCKEISIEIESDFAYAWAGFFERELNESDINHLNLDENKEEVTINIVNSGDNVEDIKLNIYETKIYVD
ncbi:MAG: hypothetical protein EF811_02060 [Methanonatronarchaeia archaeon]|nr:MAG: hypothetical protein EF811_02060 [Methanonatronarchaeia archaeon]